ncbi:hypothetical protein M409DRAFT_68601 [Zasmidium cellare ATCC 36951]|uniref:3-keto-steroid reductase n=1 Tax=Zasmidium cellare ATCC 36951 TaxID=1080233 RepID=A0A6A6C8H4_ZASCE|nr:uncharacterized protein M409DRAFT_68601 [Zasmidium cellare ATCC 36951]KAF2163335.1 hypothetical protein M409DRAFT_68601 [Zasmidium cellare ATCC 36951]
MDDTTSYKTDKVTFTVLVTGANSGLGFAISCRLIDEFLFTRPQSQTLHLLFSTRDARKSEDTQRRLRKHLQKTLQEANGRTMGISLLLEARVKLEGVLVDLLQLTSVKALAEQLLRRNQKIDAVVWNAGIAGWKGLNWPKAIWHILTDLIHASTYPTYPIPLEGLVTKAQTGSSDEPQLGQVFTANVFGHYLLTHWLSPLMGSETRIVWISSISALPETFSPEDLQGLKAQMAYEGSKRLTDLLVLTSELPSTQAYTSTFLPEQEGQRQRPKMYVTHPGVVGTSIAGLPRLLELLMFAAFYIARWLGSPWHLVSAYKGAVSAVFAVIAHASQLPELEEREGKGKWGSATGVYGDERVARTEVEGWAFCGRVGVVPTGSVTGPVGRYRGRRETTGEGREGFEEEGRRVWRELEALRGEWEGRLGGIGIGQEGSVVDG